MTSSKVTFSGVPVRAMEDVMAERQRQIEKFGHTPEQDLPLPLAQLPIAANSELRGAIDYCQFRRLDLARRYLVKTAAFCLAAIDRIDAELDLTTPPLEPTP